MKIKAKIFLFPDGRKTPFKNGYRPLFDIAGVNTSGKITLYNQVLFHPGEIGEVEIEFLPHVEFKLPIGSTITFHEGIQTLGTAEVLEILNR